MEYAPLEIFEVEKSGVLLCAIHTLRLLGMVKKAAKVFIPS